MFASGLGGVLWVIFGYQSFFESVTIGLRGCLRTRLQYLQLENRLLDDIRSIVSVLNLGYAEVEGRACCGEAKK